MHKCWHLKIILSVHQQTVSLVTTSGELYFPRSCLVRQHVPQAMYCADQASPSSQNSTISNLMPRTDHMVKLVGSATGQDTWKVTL